MDRSPLPEPIKKTTLDHVVIVTTRSDDPYSLRPFQTVAWDDGSGNALSIANFATLAAALLAHETLAQSLNH